jgi:outer membrane lipoprotein SlyB
MVEVKEKGSELGSTSNVMVSGASLGAAFLAVAAMVVTGGAGAVVPLLAGVAGALAGGFGGAAIKRATDTHVHHDVTK